MSALPKKHNSGHHKTTEEDGHQWTAGLTTAGDKWPVAYGTLAATRQK